MYARAIDDAAAGIRDLIREWEGLGLAALSLGLALAGTQVRASLAAPLFLGVLVVGTLGVRALWRRWELEAFAFELDDVLVPADERRSRIR